MSMKKVLTHGGIIIAMFVVACIYFLPILQGKALPQGDTQKFEAMAHESRLYHQQTGEYAYWNNTMFGGMPNCQIGGGKPSATLFNKIKCILDGEYIGLGQHIGVLFLYLLGFYIALVCLGLSPWLALIGALAFGLGSYNIIIIEAGHITKARALALMMPILAGMMLCLKNEGDDKRQRRRNLVAGGVLFGTALGLQIACNHIQITYYTAIGCAILGIVYLIYALKDKYIKRLLIGAAVLIVCTLFAVAGNARLLMMTQEYSKFTMRGGSELTVSPTDLYGGESRATENNADGLDIDYAFSWSYGIGETYTLLVPGAMGGGSMEPMDEESACYKAFRQSQMPLYWGDQPFTSGPVYFGAIVVFLFVLALFVVKGPERWWLLLATLVAIMMSWGRNLMGFNGWLFDHLPMYNKFRTPSMSLVLANVTMVLGAMLALKEIVTRKVKNKALYWAAGITGGLILVVMVMSGSFSFSGAGDSQMASAYGDQWQRISDLLVKDRKSLLMGDSMRSLIMIVLSAVMIWLYNNEKIKKNAVLLTALTLLVVIDLWGVDRRYLNDKNYVNSRQLALKADPYDFEIDRQAAQYGDQDYRVLNLAVNTYNDSKPSAFHRQIGGYSAVKMSRYQDLINFYLSTRINVPVVNMLNGRYIVMQNGDVQRNPDALGNAWFVKEMKAVESTNDEIMSMDKFEPKNTAIVNVKEFAAPTFQYDSTATIVLDHPTQYNPDRLTYHTKAASDQLAVMSEIYYSPDWRAYIDGKPAEYIRANYVLRAMVVPAGNHTIEFVNEAPTSKKYDAISLVVSILFVLLAAGAIVWNIQSNKKKKNDIGNSLHLQS